MPSARLTDPQADRLLEDLCLVAPILHDTVQAVRTLVMRLAPGATETVKYGGLLFQAPGPFCGVFAYRQHVSLEFSQGHALRDVDGVLQGTGRLRRHIKLATPADVEAPHVADFIRQAAALART